MLRTTVGQFLINRELPEDLRDPNRVLDKKGLQELLRAVAERHPEKYRELSHKLADLGRRMASDTGGYSVGLEHLATSPLARKMRAHVWERLKKVLDDDKLDDKQRNEGVLKAVQEAQLGHRDALLKEGLEGDNPLAHQIASGARGNPANFASLVDSDWLYSDYRDRTLPLPVMRSFSEGLTPMQYWAASFGARRGIIGTKMAVRDAGFLAKQINQLTHRLLVTGKDDPRTDQPLRGLPVDINDDDSEGALLAQDTGPYKRNTVITAKMLAELRRKGQKRLLVRSPAVGGSPEGGLYSYDVGVREHGTLPGRYEQVGMPAGHTVSEALSQGQLGAKHGGGVAGESKTQSGFKYINSLFQSPQSFGGMATHTEMDGIVSRVEPAPAGGTNVVIGDQTYHVPRDLKLRVKVGDPVEAGDVLSDGLPNPGTLVEHKGIGEGKRAWIQAMRQTLKDSGIKTSRRNLELVARGLIDHVRVTGDLDGHIPDDIVPYTALEHGYEPREGHRLVAPTQAVGRYLEQPVLHYSIGTKVRPSVLKQLQDFNIKNVMVHDEPPPFSPEYQRSMMALQHDPDVLTRMYGSGVKDSLLEGVYRGGQSDEDGTSFVPSLAHGVYFGRRRWVRSPEPGIKPPLEGPLKVAQTINPTGMVAPPNQAHENNASAPRLPAAPPAAPRPAAPRPPAVTGMAIQSATNNPAMERLRNGPREAAAAFARSQRGAPGPWMPGQQFGQPMISPQHAPGAFQQFVEDAPGGSFGQGMAMLTALDPYALGALTQGPGGGRYGARPGGQAGGGYGAGTGYGAGHGYDGDGDGVADGAGGGAPGTGAGGGINPLAVAGSIAGATALGYGADRLGAWWRGRGPVPAAPVPGAPAAGAPPTAGAPAAARPSTPAAAASRQANSAARVNAAAPRAPGGAPGGAPGVPTPGAAPTQAGQGFWNRAGRFLGGAARWGGRLLNGYNIIEGGQDALNWLDANANGRGREHYEQHAENLRNAGPLGALTHSANPVSNVDTIVRGTGDLISDTNATNRLLAQSQQTYASGLTGYNALRSRALSVAQDPALSGSYGRWVDAGGAAAGANWTDPQTGISWTPQLQRAYAEYLNWQRGPHAGAPAATQATPRSTEPGLGGVLAPFDVGAVQQSDPLQHLTRWWTPLQEALRQQSSGNPESPRFVGPRRPEPSPGSVPSPPAPPMALVTDMPRDTDSRDAGGGDWGPEPTPSTPAQTAAPYARPVRQELRSMGLPGRR